MKVIKFGSLGFQRNVLKKLVSNVYYCCFKALENDGRLTHSHSWTEDGWGIEMFKGKVVRASNVSFRSPRRARQIVRCLDNREFKIEMSRKRKRGINVRVGLIWRGYKILVFGRSCDTISFLRITLLCRWTQFQWHSWIVTLTHFPHTNTTISERVANHSVLWIWKRWTQ